MKCYKVIMSLQNFFCKDGKVITKSNGRIVHHEGWEQESKKGKVEDSSYRLFTSTILDTNKKLVTKLHKK